MLRRESNSRRFDSRSERAGGRATTEQQASPRRLNELKVSSGSRQLRSGSPARKSWDSCSQAVPWPVQVTSGNTWGRLWWHSRTVSQTRCAICPHACGASVLVHVCRLLKPRSRSACVFTSLTWRKPAVWGSGDYPVSAPHRSLLFFCLSLSVCCWLVFWGVVFFSFFSLRSFGTKNDRYRLLTSLLHCPSAAIISFLARFSLLLHSLTLTPSLVVVCCCWFFFWLNLDLSPLSCRFYPSLSSCTCSCCW